MNQIKDPPVENNSGLDFNYANWAPGTRLSLVNVPWNNDYRDIVKFDDRVALNAYIDDRETVGLVLENVSYIKPNMPVRIPTPFNSALRFNYLRASNPLQPVSGDTRRDFYYFITGINYIAPMTTEVMIQLDVWQTFGYDITFGNSYIERGHIGIANENSFDNYGRDWLTVPEGIDYGGEYQIITRRSERIMNVSNFTDDVDQDTLFPNVLVASSVDLRANAGTVSDPKLVTAKGGFLQNLVSGASYYLFENALDFFAFMVDHQTKPWVTQGIISITIVPNIKRYNPGFTFETYPEITDANFPAFEPKRYGMLDNWREHEDITDYIPERYAMLKKFFTYPYMIIEMTTWTGTPILLKPESWSDDDATVVERASYVPPNQRLMFHPYKYNAREGAPDYDWANRRTTANPDGTTNTPNGGDDGGDYLDIATQIGNFPAIAIVNNGAIAYMASNANSIAFQHSSADWAQSRALRGNEVSYDQQTAGIQASQGANALDRAGMSAQVASNQQAMLEGVSANGVIGAGLGIGSSIASGNVGGAISGVTSQLMGGVNAGIAVNQQNRNLATSQTVSKGGNTIANNQAALLRDTNKNLADWSAKGDYENQIAGINAKVQDAKLIQPTTSGQVGGEAINLLNNATELSIRWKMIDPAAMTRLGEYWLRYGYAVRKFATIPASLMAMSKFTYWKLSETYIISAPMPEFFKQSIRGIFEKGVTVWANPNDIGTIDIADNEPVEGITL